MQNPKPFSVWCLILLLGFQAIGGFAGSSQLLLNPYGIEQDFPVSMLESTPFGSFIIPGFILLIALSILPSIAVFGLLTKKHIWWMDSLNLYSDQHWAWSGAIYTGIILVFWINIQIALIGFWHFYQTVFALLGVFIIIAALYPSTMNYFRITKPNSSKD